MQSFKPCDLLGKIHPLGYISQDTRQALQDGKIKMSGFYPQENGLFDFPVYEEKAVMQLLEEVQQEILTFTRKLNFVYGTNVNNLRDLIKQIEYQKLQHIQD